MTASATPISHEPFGRTRAGEPIEIYTFRNARGAEARIINYGGIVVSLKVPDRDGNFDDVVLGYDSLRKYESDTAYFGCIAGRFANRIAKGRFSLAGRRYQLARNDRGNHLHGGVRGFNKKVWHAEPRNTRIGPVLELTYVSKDGEEGYPGNLSVTALYVLTDSNQLRLDLRATTDAETVINLTQHSYFNLAGAGRGDILGHEITINADEFTEIDQAGVPTGRLLTVEGTPFDFTNARTIGSQIGKNDQQLSRGKGYDHNFVLRTKGLSGARSAASVTEPTTGRRLEVFTTQPAMQFYSGNFLDGSIVGKKRKRYAYRSGFCMEPQHYPDSPNHPEFPSTILKPGETYQQTITYRFSTV